MKISKLIALLLCICLVGTAGAEYLIPGGNTIGVRAYSDGLVITETEPDSPAQRAGLQAGDVLQEINGTALQTPEQLLSALKPNTPLTLMYSRRGRLRQATVVPDCRDGACSLGAYVRSAVSGIGTVTYYDEDNQTFGALGHGITDASGETLLPITGGIVVPSSVVGIVPGTPGKAGQLEGEFDTSVDLGTVEANTPSGIFGSMQPPAAMPYPVAAPEDAEEGPATIRANISGTEIGEYSIEIVKIYRGKEQRDMLLRVTDPALLAATGGIVQGMSGSPILQNGKLLGAVTHVLVNDPTMGYGIFLENMLSAQQKAS